MLPQVRPDAAPSYVGGVEIGVGAGAVESPAAAGPDPEPEAEWLETG